MALTIVIAVLAINVLVLVHELGHFLAGKLKGIEVEIFSIGFGPRVLGFKRKGTDYRLSLFLLGGYVKFRGDEPEEDNRKDIPGGFYTAGPWTRIMVCTAGGVFNLLLAAVLYTVIFFCGKPVPLDALNTVVGAVEPGSAAASAGITPGDRISDINGKPVAGWEELVYAVAFSRGNDISVTIDRKGETIIKELRLIPDPATGVKMMGVYSKETVVVGKVLAGSPAQEAGLKVKDQISAINGEPVYRTLPLIETIRENEGKEITLTVARNGKMITIKAVPRKLGDKDYPAIGFVPVIRWTTIYPKPWAQFGKDLARTWRTLTGLVTRQIPLKAVSGPVGIIKIIGISLQAGIMYLAAIVALISLNLGIINLLPIPVLDGGHILFTLVEIARGKPVSLKIMERIQNVFIVLLILLFLYITFNDILRW